MLASRTLLLLMQLAVSAASVAASSTSLIDYRDYIPGADVRRVYTFSYLYPNKCIPLFYGVSGCPLNVVEVVRHIAPDKLRTTTTISYDVAEPAGTAKRITVLTQRMTAAGLSSISLSGKDTFNEREPDGYSGDLSSYSESYSPASTTLKSIHLDPIDPRSAFYKSHPLGSWSSYSAVTGQRKADPSSASEPYEKGLIASYTVLGIEDVTVPAGTFGNCLKLKIEKRGSEQLDWVCPDVGLVRRYWSPPWGVSGQELEQQLTSISPL